MKKIILFGAGKSATCLIDYLIAESAKKDWHLTVVDADRAMAERKTGHAACVSVESFDINDDAIRAQWIGSCDLVISLLPASLHIQVARDCIRLRKHLLTASYISPDIQALKDEIKAAGILFMGEMGLDPGIDHMSAMKMLDEIRSQGHSIQAFEGYCGALMSPESNNNPWEYKFSWNPMSVVLAGMSGAQYRQGGKNIQVPYEALFHNNPVIDVPGLGSMAYYPNRDSLHYIPIYHLENVAVVMRATLRYPAFCRGWDALIKLGLTNNERLLETRDLSYRDWTLLQVPECKTAQAEKRLADFLSVKENSPLFSQLRFLGLLDEAHIGSGRRTSAEILLHTLMDKLKMDPADHDMIVMLHKITFEADGKLNQRNSCLIVKGQDDVRTAIAKTVGLPLGILAKLMLMGKINLSGLHIPVSRQVYLPVLQELESHGIVFKEYGTQR